VLVLKVASVPEQAASQELVAVAHSAEAAHRRAQVVAAVPTAAEPAA